MLLWHRRWEPVGAKRRALGYWRWPIRCTASAWRNVTVAVGVCFHLPRHHRAMGKVWKPLPGSRQGPGRVISICKYPMVT